MFLNILKACVIFFLVKWKFVPFIWYSLYFAHQVSLNCDLVVHIDAQTHTHTYIERDNYIYIYIKIYKIYIEV